MDIGESIKLVKKIVNIEIDRCMTVFILDARLKFLRINI